MTQPPPPWMQPPFTSTTGLTWQAHTLHAAASFCTCGLWVPVWIAHAVFASRKTVIR